MNFSNTSTRHKWWQHRRKWAKCKLCEIGAKVTEHVFARGDLPADFLFIGEAPGETEDIVGEPFRGDAGNMFDMILRDVRVETKADFSFCVTNILLCRPTAVIKGRVNNRAPEKEEAQNCSPRLAEFFKLCDPKAIICLGKVAAKFFPERSLPRLEITHPSYWLRTGREHGVEYKRAKIALRKFLKEHS